MLTPEERARIIEEENLRNQIRNQQPVNTLSSCILWPIAIVGLIIGLGILLVLGTSILKLLHVY